MTDQKLSLNVCQQVGSEKRELPPREMYKVTEVFVRLSSPTSIFPLSVLSFNTPHLWLLHLPTSFIGALLVLRSLSGLLEHRNHSRLTPGHLARSRKLYHLADSDPVPRISPRSSPLLQERRASLMASKLLSRTVLMCPLTLFNPRLWALASRSELNPAETRTLLIRLNTWSSFSGLSTWISLQSRSGIGHLFRLSTLEVPRWRLRTYHLFRRHRC